MRIFFVLALLVSSSAFADTTAKVLETCVVASTNPNNDAKYTVTIESVDVPSSDSSWPTSVIFAVVNYSGPLQGGSGVEVTHEIGVYSITPSGPIVPTGASYYAGITAGTLFELAVNFQPGQATVQPGTGKLTFTDDTGKKLVLSSSPALGESTAYSFSCK